MNKVVNYWETKMLMNLVITHTGERARTHTSQYFSIILLEKYVNK